jgi:hypothetical protein
MRNRVLNGIQPTNTFESKGDKKMKKSLCFVLAFSVLFIPALTRVKKVSFDAEAAWSYVVELASDEMEGRRSGQPGGDVAEEYIASKFKEWGLEPAGERGTYFQNFTFEHFFVKPGAALEIVSPQERRIFYCENDWMVEKFSGSGHLMTEIVFVGYGIHAPDKEYDDYRNVDVKGKLVLLSDKIPERIREKFWEATKMENRIEAAQELGAKGIMAFNYSDILEKYVSGIWFKSELYKKDFIWLSVNDNIVNFIFKELKTDLRYHKSEAEKGSKPTSFETGVKAFVSISTLFDKKRPARNILAKITGQDKNLKNEYVVIGAHMDHLGFNPRGEVFNGANDNASGTAVVLEIARIMKLNKAKPKRTVVFALWAGEEQGLLGSKHYGENPLFPMEKTVVNFNMDMAGHGKEKVILRGVSYYPQIWKLLQEKLPKQIVDSIKTHKGGPGGSDHTPFMDNGVPAFFVQSDGPHFKYHQTRDDFDLIQKTALKKVGDFVHAATNIMASEPGDFIIPGRQEKTHLKYQTLINYEFSSLTHVLESHKDTKNSHVDLQLSVIEEKQGLIGGHLRLDILKRLLNASKEIQETKGLQLYTSASRLSGDPRQDNKGKTTVMIGLRGINSLRDDLAWAQIMANQGVCFVIAENPQFLFDEKGLSQEGEKIIDVMNEKGLLLIFKGLNTTQARAVVTGSKNPIILLQKKIPEEDFLELIKQKKSALGLILEKKEDPSHYFQKIDRAKKLIGTERLMIVNEQCLWGKAGKNQMLKLMSEILRADYKGKDVFNLFSATFLRFLVKLRGEKQPLFWAAMPL